MCAEGDMVLRAILLGGSVIAVGVLFGAPGSSADDDGCFNNPYNRPEGQLIEYPQGTIYLTSGCTRRHITDPVALNSHHFDGNLSNIRDISVQEFNLLPSGPPLRVREGTILRNSSTGALYIIDEIGYQTGNYQKRYITSSGWQALFAPCGSYPATNVSPSYLGTYDWGPNVYWYSSRPDGQLISVSGTVYMLEGGKKRWIVNPPALQSYNFVQPACDVSASEAAGYATGSNMWAREGTLVASGNPVYVIRESGGFYEKRHIPSREAFDYYGFQWGAIRSWSQTYINQYGDGSLAHPVKSTFSSAWYIDLVSNDLRMDKRYIGVPQGSWDAQITAARNAWNAAAIAPDFNEVPISASNEVNVEVRDWGPLTPWGGQAVVIEFTNGKIRKMRVDLNDNAQFVPSTPLVAHELGHVLRLAHDGLNPDNDGDGLPDLDGACGTSRVPETIMDYDCYVGDPFLVGPVDWDACGVNHLYYPGNYAGC